MEIPYAYQFYSMTLDVTSAALVADSYLDYSSPYSSMYSSITHISMSFINLMDNE